MAQRGESVWLFLTDTERRTGGIIACADLSVPPRENASFASSNKEKSRVQIATSMVSINWKIKFDFSFEAFFNGP